MIRPSGPCPAKIMLVGEMPGDQEVLKGQPFEGMAGEELSRMLADAGIMRSVCFISSVLRVKLPGGTDDAIPMKKKAISEDRHVLYNGTWVHKEVVHGIELLKREIELCQPNVIIAFGRIALFALFGDTAIGKWRGSELQIKLPTSLPLAPKLIPTYSPSQVLQVWSRRPIVVQDLRRALRESYSKELSRLEYKFLLRPEYQQARAVLTSILLQLNTTRDPLPLSVDIETRRGHIACIGFAWSRTEAICIPLLCVERQEGYWSLDEETELISLMRRILTHSKLKLIGQNFLYDAQYLYRYWLIVPTGVFDTMLAQHVCFAGMEKALDYLSSMYCEHHLYWKDDGKEWTPDVDEDQLWSYNCMDCVRTFEVAGVLEKTVNYYQLAKVNAFQQELFYPVLNSMLRGIRIDAKTKAGFAMHLMEELNARQTWINYVVGEPLNTNSSPQMKQLFYSTLGQKEVLSRKGRERTVTCDDEALQKIATREPILRPLVNKITELRSIGVFLSTFVNSNTDIDSRMRCSYNIAGTDTYRFASKKNAFGSGLNLQNVPNGSDDSGLVLPNVRKLFIPDPGMEFFDIDLSSADLRIVVWEANETEMKAMLAEGYDPYTVIAQEFYHDKTITKKDPRRQTFKSFAHGTHYLGTARGLAERLGLSVAEAEKTQKWYFQRFPRIKIWQDNLKEQVFKRKMVQNIFGYRFNILDRIDQSTLNAAAAWIPQSTVACLINRAYLAIYKTQPEVQILLQVHDSLAGQYPIAGAEAFRKAIVAAAEIPLPYADPLTIPVGIKTSQVSWGDCK